MGLAIKITGQDFSQNNLGKVTFIEDAATLAASKAASYCLAIGDTTYQLQYENMFRQLIDEGLWKKIYGLYPISGKSLQSMRINAADVSRNSLVTYANASVGDNAIKFANNIGVGDIKDTKIDALEGEFSIYAIFKHIRGDINGATLNKFTGSSNGVASINRISTTIYALWGGQNVDINLDTATIGRVGITNVGTGTVAAIIKDGNVFNTIDSPLAIGITPNLNVGVSDAKVGNIGESIDASMDLFSGELYFYMIGNLNQSELMIFDRIVSEFVSEVA